MTIRDEIVGMIIRSARVSVSAVAGANLYTELGMDSLAFVALLVEIEERYSIDFDIAEMEACLEVERLVEMTEAKVKERDEGNDPGLPAEPK